MLQNSYLPADTYKHKQYKPGRKTIVRALLCPVRCPCIDAMHPTVNELIIFTVIIKNLEWRYARYSSDNQREEFIEGRIRECMEFAERQGINCSRLVY